VRYAFGLVALLVVVGIVLFLSSSHTQHDIEAVRLGAAALHEDVAATSWDDSAADDLLDRLTRLAGDPEPSREDLRAAAATAAGWVAGTSPGSRQNHAAVKLRSAADELAQASSDLGDRHRVTARRCLEDARAALAGAPPRELDAIQGVRDQIENLQNSRREQAREAQEP
jgi:hypothetical protein